MIFHWSLSKNNGFSFPYILTYVVTAVSPCSVCDFPHVVTALSQRIMDVFFPCIVIGHLISSECISICCHCCFNKQWMWFSTGCHCSISKNNGCIFTCVLTAHLISSRWTSICCHCCFIMQWMWFATCFHYRKRSVCFHCLLNKPWIVFNMLLLLFMLLLLLALSPVCGFPDVVLAMFQASVHSIFLVLSLHV